MTALVRYSIKRGLTMNHKWMIQTNNEVVTRPPMPAFFIGYVMSMAVLILLGSGNAEEPKQMTEEEYTLRRIGSVHKKGGHTSLVLNKEIEPALRGLDGFSHVWVFWWFDRNDTPEKRSVLQVHPRGDRKNPLTGVFACRSPARPNLVALTLCRVLSVKGNVVNINKIDAFSGTPILDLKPYIPDNDSAEASIPDWLKKKKSP